MLLITPLGVKFICILKLQFDFCGVYLLENNGRKKTLTDRIPMFGSRKNFSIGQSVCHFNHSYCVTILRLVVIIYSNLRLSNGVHWNQKRGWFYKRSVTAAFWATFSAHLPSSPKEGSAMLWSSAQDTQVPQTVVYFCQMGKVSPSKGSPGEEWAVFPRPADEGKTAMGRTREHFWAKCISRLEFQILVILYYILLPVMWCLPWVGPLEFSHKSM